MRLFTVYLFFLVLSVKVNAYKYPQRFNIAEYRASDKLSKDFEGMLATFSRLTNMYPWLNDIEQPSVEIRFDKKLYYLKDMIGLPPKFYSQRQTVYRYQNGAKVFHAYIDLDTPMYERFKERYGRTDIEKKQYGSQPIMVFLHDKTTFDNYIYVQRSLNYLQNVFAGYDGFDFRSFLVNASPPLLNAGAGGNILSVQINNDRELRERRKERGVKGLDAFSLDISGSYNSYIYNPWYLFADIKNSGLPDDSFGTVLLLGGPLKKREVNYKEALEIIREVTRIASPQGQILIEIDAPPKLFISLLDNAEVPYRDYVIYEGVDIGKDNKINRHNLLRIILNKDM